MSRKMLSTRAFAAVATASVAALSAAPIFAQGVAAPAASAAGDSQLGEIIVTATKHATTLQTTPMAITAVSGANLQDRGIADFNELAATVPSVSMKSNGPGQTEFEMRGMDSSGGNSPTVGFYLNDIAMTAPAAAQNGKVVIDPALYDLERVEVLRGPQGTLYGSGSMGGTVRLITHEPVFNRVLGSVDSSVSNTARGGGMNNSENAMFNLPLGEKAALRVVGTDSYTSGWINRIAFDTFPQPANGGTARGDVLGALQSSTNVVNEPRSNATRLDGVRATLEWRPTDDLTITPFVFYQTLTQDGPSAYDSVPGTNAHYEPFLIPEPTTDRVDVYNLDVKYSFSAFDFKSITAQWYRSSTLIQDGSENMTNPVSGFGTSGTFYGPNGTGPIYGKEIDPSQQFTQEFRLSSKDSSRLQWVAGLFYSNFKSDWQLYTDITNPQTIGSPISNIWTILQRTHIDQYALYGDLTYPITDKLKVDVGIRGYKYTNHFFMSASGFGEPSGTNTPMLTYVDQSNSGSTPKFDLSYQATPDQMYYVTVARGFRPGGGNQPMPNFPLMTQALTQIGFPNGAPLGYAPDSVWSYEGGAKLKLLDGRAVVDAAVYYENWNNIQLEALPADYPLFVNAGNARIKGAELEIRALLGAGWEMAMGAGETDGSLSNSEHGFVAGQRLPEVAKFSGNVRLTYNHPLGDATLHSLLETTYMGSRVDTTFPQGVTDTQTPLSPYALTNLRVGMRWDKFDVTAFATNVFDKRATLEFLTQLTLPNPGYNRVETNQPRTVGVDLSYRFH
ncbi:MAG: TonB-dependent receptor [Gammaproteobacteria bacterium]|nr:TonB-dependent receptor [Gammaproteobacteria bacterium]